MTPKFCHWPPLNGWYCQGNGLETSNRGGGWTDYRWCQRCDEDESERINLRKENEKKVTPVRKRLA